MNLFVERKYIIGGLFVLVIFIYIMRLFYLEVIDISYKLSANNNVLRPITQYPARGLIYDRNGKLMVYNEAAFDLMIIPCQVKAFDTLDLCKIVEIDKEQLISQIKKAKSYSYYRPSIIQNQLSSKTYAILQEKMYKYQGFFVQSRTLRKYLNKSAAHLLGYVSEIDESELSKDKYYRSGDYIGKSGIENSYEKYLRGKKGVKLFLVDVHNRIKGSFANGEHDTSAVIGSDLTLSIDAELQKYGELLMQHKKGSIVAIEPSTGEILTLISSPGYDPGLLVGRVRSLNYNKLLKDTLKPLFNRALMAKYPPGSTFKLINALIGLQEQVISTRSVFECSHGYHAGRFSLKCHHSGSIDFLYSIQASCNAYYCYVFRKILDNRAYRPVSRAYNVWRNYVTSFGLGNRLSIDIPNELKGNIPSVKYYNKCYNNRWNSLTVVSLAIGQGELGITPLQMANMITAIANRGYYYTPHVVKGIRWVKSIDKKYIKKNEIPIDKEYFDDVIEGMELVISGGTGISARIDGITMCGKTGTAQNPHGKDHSIFTCFAPKDNPKIVIAVYIENAGFGSVYAAPIASLMVEKYLTHKVTRPEVEENIINQNLIGD